MVEHVDALPRSEDVDILSDDFPSHAKPLNSSRIFCWTC